MLMFAYAWHVSINTNIAECQIAKLPMAMMIPIAIRRLGQQQPAIVPVDRQRDFGTSEPTAKESQSPNKNKKKQKLKRTKQTKEAKQNKTISLIALKNKNNNKKIWRVPG
jgi:hypothetical protein